ncbi:hypothetical protein [Hydrogenophaga sp.]|uniref:hypothetical protein n=1 Tax=Hydrogenophaga sp. TaxID=1904254 RepID=UPI0035B19E1A
MVLRWLACALAAWPLAVQAVLAAQGTSRALSQVDLVCDAIYLPARSSWTRSVRVHYDDRRVRRVEVDGLPVYAFNVQGTTILTALDNERIQIDLAQQTWTSDFRGQASAQGRCERVSD